MGCVHLDEIGIIKQYYDTKTQTHTYNYIQVHTHTHTHKYKKLINKQIISFQYPQRSHYK